MPAVTRRAFLATSAVSLSAATMPGRARPNDRIRLAVMGLRTRGKQLIPGFISIPESRSPTHRPDEAMVRRPWM